MVSISVRLMVLDCHQCRVRIRLIYRFRVSVSVSVRNSGRIKVAPYMLYDVLDETPLLKTKKIIIRSHADALRRV